VVELIGIDATNLGVYALEDSASFNLAPPKRFLSGMTVFSCDGRTPELL
jgi:hypothetical protein